MSTLAPENAADRPGTRRRRIPPLAVAGICVGVLGCSLILRSTWSGFTMSTANAGNDFSAATMSLTDNDGGSYKMFSATGSNPSANAAALTPGHPVVECIRVDYSSSASTTPHVKFSATGTTTSTDLADYLTLTVDRGTVTGTPTWNNAGGNRESCGSAFTPDSGAPTVWTGTVSALYSRTASTGIDTGTWSNSDSHWFRITADVRDDAAAIGRSTSPVTFTWTATTD